MELTDLLPLEKWAELETEIHARSGLESNVFNTDGIRITDNKVWVNRLCPAIKATDKGQAFICAVAHMNLAAMAGSTGCSQVASTRNRFRPCVQTAWTSPSCDSSLIMTHGFLSSM